MGFNIFFRYNLIKKGFKNIYPNIYTMEPIIITEEITEPIIKLTKLEKLRLWKLNNPEKVKLQKQRYYQRKLIKLKEIVV